MECMQPRRAATPLGPVEFAEFGQGPAVLSLHGALGGWDQGIILARALEAPGFRFIAPSRPGYLGTPLSSGASPEAQADLCAGLLDALGLQDALVLAISGGGPCAQQFALRHRERCRGLALVSTIGVANAAGPPPAFRVMTWLARIPWILAAMRRKALANLDRAATRSFPDEKQRARVLGDPGTRALYAALRETIFERMPGRMAGTWNDVAVARALSVPLERIHVPVLLAHGEQDPIAPYASQAGALASRIPGAELLTLERGGHAALFSHRDAIRARFGRFFLEHASLDPAAGRH
ncbi:alpha/beta fold hydrolase [Desulfovibrio sp.]